MKGFIGSVVFLATTAAFAADAVVVTTPEATVMPDPCVNLPTPATIQACERGRQAPAVVAPVAVEPTETVIQTTQPAINTMPAWQQALIPPVTTTTTSVQTTAPGTTAVVPAPGTVVTTPETTVTTTEVQTTAPTNTAPVILEETVRPAPIIREGTTVIEKAY